MPIPPSALSQSGTLLLFEPSCFCTSAAVWPLVYSMNCSPCGALPLLARVTSTNPPLDVFGAWNAAFFPCSLIDRLSAVGFGLLLPPQPATSAAAIAATGTASRNRLIRTPPQLV